jgi:hypothetical protein
MLPATLPQFDPKHLFRRLARLRWRLRGIAFMQGMLALGAWVVGSAVIVGLLDYFLHLPALVRAWALVGMIAGSAWIVWRWLVRPLTRPVDNFHLALRLEERYPDLHDALASAIQFMGQPWDDEDISSPLLRRITIRRAVRLSEECDFGELVSWRGLLSAGGAFFVALLVALPLWRLYPKETVIALTRLGVPFGTTAWPATTSVRIVAPAVWPLRHPMGEPLEIHARVDGLIPERATLSLWFDGTPPIDSVWRVTDDGELVVRLEAGRIPRDFRFRLKANDGTTPWYEVHVLPPPELVPLNGRASPMLRLEYPPYTGLLPKPMPDGATSFEAVAGTNVYLQAAVSRPIARAWIVYRPEMPILSISAHLLALTAQLDLGGLLSRAVASSITDPVPAMILRDGTVIQVKFTPRLPGVYALRFEDETGFGATRMIDARIFPDPAPSVVLERPSASQDSLHATPQAELPLQAVINDPTFAVRSAWLEYRTEKGSPPRTNRLFDHRVVGWSLTTSGSLPAARVRLPHVLVQGRLRLATFRHPDGSPLKENDTVYLQVAADDFDDVTGEKQPGRSHEVELHIVSAATLEAMLQQEQAAIRSQLLRLQQWQREAREKVGDAKAQKDATGQLRPADLEKLLQAEQLQQQIRNRVGDEKEGLRAEVNRIRNALQDNRMPPSAAQHRMDAVAGELERLARDELSALEPLLNAARERGEQLREESKSNQSPQPERGNPRHEPADGKSPSKSPEPPKEASPSGPEKEPLAEALKRQRYVEQALEQLLQRLEPWSGANEVRSETRSLLDEQRRLAQQIEQLDRQVEKARRELLPPEQQADLDRAAARQEALGNQLSQLIDKMERLSKEKAAQEQQRRQTADQLEKNAQELEKNHSPRLDAPSETKAEVERLRQQAEQQHEAANSLKREAEALADTARMAREQLASDTALAQPQNKLHQAARDIKDNKLGNANQRQQEATRSLQQMLDRLEERRSDDLDRLAKKLREAENRLDDLVDQQERLQKKAREAQSIGDAKQQQEALERLAREQEQIQEQTRELLEELSRLRADGAAQALSRASRSMEDARQRMERGAPSDDAQDETLDKLDQAQDQLEQQRQLVEEELAREKLAKVTERIRGIRDRQQTLNRDMKRLHNTALETKAWDRPLMQSLIDQADLERGLADELEQLIEGPYKSIRVVAKILGHATEAMRLAGERIEARLDDIKVAQDQNEPFDPQREEKLHAAVVRWQETAVRRLDQLLDSLKPDKDLQSQSGRGGQAGGGEGGQGAGGGGSPRDDVPLLAQLKALRALQAEVNERTAQFAKQNPDLSKLSDDEQAELRLLRRMQGDIAELLHEYSALAEQPKPGGNQP